jgi:hypothetical protein
MLSSPVLFIIFNRPETTERVFARIREARPAKLYVSADGPRANRPDDESRCAITRAIIDKVDWPCQVIKRFHDANFGCKSAVSSAIDWFFENEEMGIILEDDCLPDPTFFQFCQECLERYKDDDRVFHINGSNYQMGWQRDPDYSYYFSRYNSIWGWASWRRAWKYYDVSLKQWPEARDKNLILDMYPIRMHALTIGEFFQKVYEGKIDTWDYQWSFAIRMNNGACIVPNKNLISNIGFEGEATHTTRKIKRAGLPTSPIGLPVKHPPYMVIDAKSDRRYFGIHGRRGIVWTANNLWKLLK